MKLKELASVLATDARKNAEVRKEHGTRGIGYDIVCQGAGSSVHGDKEVIKVYPVVFNGEKYPSLVIWVK